MSPRTGPLILTNLLWAALLAAVLLTTSRRPLRQTQNFQRGTQTQSIGSKR